MQRTDLEKRVLAAAKAWLAAFNTDNYEAAFAALEAATTDLVQLDEPEPEPGEERRCTGEYDEDD